MSATQDPRERLSRIAAQLRELSFPASPIRVDDAVYLADAIERYLNGAEPSMDRALGLVRGPGAHPDPKVAERNVRLAREVLQEVWQGARLTDDRSEDGAITVVAERNQLRVGTVRDAYYEHRAAVLLAELLERFGRST